MDLLPTVGVLNRSAPHFAPRVSNFAYVGEFESLQRAFCVNELIIYKGQALLELQKSETIALPRFLPHRLTESNAFPSLQT